MDIERLKNRIDSCIVNHEEVYQPDKLMVTKFKARYNQFLRELDFNLVTFGKDTLIHYFSSWSNKERFGKLEYYSNLLASGESRGELFVLYATVKINDAIISYLRSLPEEETDELKEIPNKVLYSLQRSIENLDSIPEKLEVLREFYKAEVEGRMEVPEIFRDTPIGHVAFLPKYKEEVETISFEIFPEANRLYTTLYIPDSLFRFNFEFVQDDPEYTFWFLKYNGKKHFESYIMCEIYEDLQSPLRKEHIEGYLKELENVVKVVKELVSSHQIHSSKHNPEFPKETELLRILEGYYELNPLNDVFSTDSVNVELYAKHIFLKDYLEGLRRTPTVINSKKLEHYFSEASHFKAVMEILVQEGKCHPETYRWVDRGSGYMNYLGYFFRDLSLKGYLIDNNPMTLKQIMEVADNTFGVKLSFSTVQKTSQPPEYLFKFLPYAFDLSKKT